MNIILLSLSLIFTISISFSIVLFSLNNKNKVSSDIKINKIKNYENYVTFLQFQLEKAYQMVYKNRILPYSMEAYSLDKSNYDATLKDFVNLSLKFLGPRLQKDLTNLFGSYDSLIMNITEFFNTKYENDEIRKTSFDNLTDQENSE